MKDKHDDHNQTPERELTAYERWELPLLDQQGNEVPREEVREIQPLTAADLEEIRKAAVDDGYSEGREAGYAKGFAKGREAGYQDGHESGIAAGTVEGHEAALQQTCTDVEVRFERLDALMGALLTPIQRQKEEIETALVNLTTALARAVVYRELSMDSSHMHNLVSQAMAALPSTSDSVKLRINPADTEWVRAVAEQFEAETSIVEDADILAGGCKLETRYSLVDFTVEKRFQKAVQAMLDKQLTSDDGSDAAGLDAAMGELTDFHRDLLTEDSELGEYR